MAITIHWFTRSLIIDGGFRDFSLTQKKKKIADADRCDLAFDLSVSVQTKNCHIFFCFNCFEYIGLYSFSSLDTNDFFKSIDKVCRENC